MLGKIAIILALLSSSLSPTLAHTNDIEKVQHWLSLPNEKIDFAKIKIDIDKLADPSLDADKTLKSMDTMVAEVSSLFRPDAKSMEKYLALKKYLYEKGPWNNNHAFQYDFDDPMGYKISNKILANYLKSRKGNCVSMPILFLALGQKLGLDLSLSTAPAHVLVKFTESETGRTFNVEATSGGGLARDEWYRQQMPMTDEAVAKGIYLQKLSNKESAAVIATLLAEHYYAQNQFDKAIKVFKIVLEAYPKSIYSILKTGSAYYQILNRDFFQKYKHLNQMPPPIRERFEYYRGQNRYFFSKADSLGWQEPPKTRKDQYLNRTKNAAKGAY